MNDDDFKASVLKKLDGIDTRLAHVEDDVAELKDDVKDMKETAQLHREETQHGFASMSYQITQLEMRKQDNPAFR